MAKIREGKDLNQLKAIITPEDVAKLYSTVLVVGSNIGSSGRYVFILAATVTKACLTLS